VFNDTILFIAAAFSSTIRWHHQLSQYTRLQEFSRAIEGICNISGVWGFVDGTFRGCRRPGNQGDQKLVFSGHKRLHGLNWQGIATPDGLISSLTGAFAGPVNDWAMWRRSGCEEAIRDTLAGQETLYIYGDPAYNTAFGVACPFEHPRGRRFLNRQQQAFNKALSSVRIAVEQAFGDIQVQWTYTAFAKGLTAGKQPIAAYFAVAVLLTNCYICMRRRTGRFGVSPPHIRDYLSMYTLPV
jgi:DDE superfamily endonuclease